MTPQINLFHTRLRLHCSSLNSDLLNNHITDNNTCLCGDVENAEHYLLYWYKKQYYREIDNPIQYWNFAQGL